MYLSSRHMVFNQTFHVALVRNVNTPAVILMAILMPADIIWLDAHNIKTCLSSVQRFSASKFSSKGLMLETFCYHLIH